MSYDWDLRDDTKGRSPEEWPDFSETVETILRAVPDLRPVLDEHLADQDGQLLAYLLLPDFVRDLNRRWATATLSAATLERFASAVEEEYCKDDRDIADLLTLGLLEELENSAIGPEVEKHLGRLSQEALSELREWHE